MNRGIHIPIEKINILIKLNVHLKIAQCGYDNLGYKNIVIC